MLNMKTYTKKNFKYWTAKKLNKHSKTIWLGIAVLIVWFIFYGLLFKLGEQYNSGKLVSPLTGIMVTQVYASELRKEDTKAWKMYQWMRKVESSYGTQGLAVTCKKKGMINEVGWGGTKGICFKSEWDQELTTMQYIEKRLNQGWTESQVKCYWNTGTKLSNCAYSLEDLANAK